MRELLKIVQESGVDTPSNNDLTQVYRACLYHIQRWKPNWAVDIGSINSIIVELTPPPISYTPGLVVRILMSASNTGATILRCQPLSPKNVVGPGGSNPLVGGELAAGGVYEFVYDGTNFQLLRPPVATGATGPSGPPGVIGSIGPDGATGSQGVQGATGIQGVIGPKGPSGPRGPQGQAGQEGLPGPTRSHVVMYGKGSSVFTVPSGISNIKIRAWGAGGAGSLQVSGFGSAGNGGGSGAYVEGYLSVTAGQTIQLNVGQGAPRTAQSGSGAGASGGSTFVSGIFIAGGGQGATTDHPGAGGVVSVTSGNLIAVAGRAGRKGYTGFAYVNPTDRGTGPGAPFGGGPALGSAGFGGGEITDGTWPGGAGSGGKQNTQDGGAGADGLAMIEW